MVLQIYCMASILTGAHRFFPPNLHTYVWRCAVLASHTMIMLILAPMIDEFTADLLCLHCEPRTACLMHSWIVALHYWYTVLAMNDGRSYQGIDRDGFVYAREDYVYVHVMVWCEV